MRQYFLCLLVIILPATSLACEAFQIRSPDDPSVVSRTKPHATTKVVMLSQDGATTISTTTSTTTALSNDSSLDDILDALDRVGRNLKSLTADVALTEVDTQLGGSSKRSGKVWLESSTDTTRFHALFDRVETDGKKKIEKLEYVLDNGKLIDRNYAKTTQVTRVVQSNGEKTNLLKLGEGPFPLPIGQPREDVHKSFDVKKLELAKDDPAGTLHIELIPKEGTSLSRKMKSIEVFVNPSDSLPVRISTLDPSENTQRVTDLSHLTLNGPISDADFKMEKIDEASWNKIDEAFETSH